MRMIVDEMGKASAVAQELKLPITSANKLIDSDHIIYVMTEHNRPGYVLTKLTAHQLYTQEVRASHRRGSFG